jgi:Icc protein
LVPGKDSGYLSDKTLLELRQHLEHTASLGSHTVVGLHHPPFLVNSEWLDSSTLQQPQRLFQVLDEFSHVKLVLFGHIHQDFYHCRQGVTYLGCPSTCIQFQPKSRYFSLEVIPPAYRRFCFHPDGTFRTELMRVPQGLQHPNLHIGGY